jgi:N-acetylglucosaminyl-diphospho-decaprenol L-rhamnosyltransferase
MTAAAEILVVIVNYRTPDLAQKCLEALQQQRDGLRLSVVLVDGGSGDGSAAQLKAYIYDQGWADWVELLALDFNGGFGWANNQAILHRAGGSVGLPSYIYLLNPDAEAMPGAVTALKSILDQHPNVAAVGSQLIELDGSPAASAFRFPSLGREFIRGARTHALHRLTGIKPIAMTMDQAGPVDWVTGASVMIRRDALNDTGLFDDSFFLYFEEVELMHRMQRAGWHIWHQPKSLVKHIGGAATGVQHSDQPKPYPDYWFQSRARYFTLTGGRLRGFFANMVWFFGYCTIWLPRSLLKPSLKHRAVPGEGQGIAKAGLVPTIGQSRAGHIPITHATGTPPHWTGKA